jgi:diguanylate cyclase (GGDEF)-like protein
VNNAGTARAAEQDRAQLDELMMQNAALLAEIAVMTARIAELEELADSDTLTPLANRRAFLRRLDQAIRQVARHATPVALVFIDLDGLKLINDAHGHLAGDAALCHVADRLKSGLRATDLVARIGGDEFGLVLDHARQEDVTTRLSRLVRSLQEMPLVFQTVEIPVALSWGLTMISDDDNVDGAIARADAAMYAAKAAQRSDR